MRIANTHSTDAAARGWQSASYEESTLEELYERAQEVGIEGRSQMSKEDLTEALRED